MCSNEPGTFKIYNPICIYEPGTGTSTPTSNVMVTPTRNLGHNLFTGPCLRLYLCHTYTYLANTTYHIYIYIVYMFPIATSYMTCYALHTYMLHMCYVYITRRVRMNTYSLNTTVLLHVAYACKPRCHLKTPTIQTLYMYLCALNTLPLNFQHVPYTLYNTIRRPQTRSQNIFYIYYLYACFITCHMQYGYI